MCLPPGIDFAPPKPATTAPAKMYPFQLDAFQREAILVIYILEGSGSWRIFGITVAYFSESWIQKSFQCIENNESVLVSTHTSAGKTVVAL